MCIATLLIIVSLIILLFIIINGYKNITNTEPFRGHGYGGGSGHYGNRGGHGYYGNRGGRGGRGYGYGGGHHGINRYNYNVGYSTGGGWRNSWWWDPYYWGSWFPYYNGGNGYEYWRQCPQGTWCPPYLDCDSPECN